MLHPATTCQTIVFQRSGTQTVISDWHLIQSGILPPRIV
jgi:hypothetical protein